MLLPARSGLRLIPACVTTLFTSVTVPPSLTASNASDRLVYYIPFTSATAASSANAEIPHNAVIMDMHRSIINDRVKFLPILSCTPLSYFYG